MNEDEYFAIVGIRTELAHAGILSLVYLCNGTYRLNL